MNANRSDWTTDARGRALGRELHDSISPSRRPEWAAQVLERCAAAAVPVREVEDLLRIAERPDRWREAHAAFRRVRTLAIAEERARGADALRSAVFATAETTAKIAYNASGGPLPFDSDAEWRLACDARRVADLAEDPALVERLWEALTRPATTDAAER